MQDFIQQEEQRRRAAGGVGDGADAQDLRVETRVAGLQRVFDVEGRAQRQRRDPQTPRRDGGPRQRQYDQRRYNPYYGY